MDLEIQPEPTAQEREAIAKAIAQAEAAGRARKPGPWWQAGVDAALGIEEPTGRGEPPLAPGRRSD